MDGVSLTPRTLFPCVPLPLPIFNLSLYLCSVVPAARAPLVLPLAVLIYVDVGSAAAQFLVVPADSTPNSIFPSAHSCVLLSLSHVGFSFATPECSLLRSRLSHAGFSFALMVSSLMSTSPLLLQGVTMTDDQIAGMCIAMLLAGQHTSSTTGAWMGFYLCAQPELQYVDLPLVMLCIASPALAGLFLALL